MPPRLRTALIGSPRPDRILHPPAAVRPRRAAALVAALLSFVPLPPETVSAATCQSPDFSAQPFVPVQSNPANIALGDWNKDGHVDFAVTNTGSDSVSIRFGNGSGGFTGSSNVSIGAGTQPLGIAVGDFDGDQFLDLAVAAPGTGRIKFLRGGLPLGTFVLVGSDLTSLPANRAVVAADFDRDGRTDLAVASYGNDRVEFFLRTGTFSFAVGQPVLIGQNPSSLAVGDFDRDGDLDVAATNETDDNVSFLQNDGSGVFSEPGGAAARTPVGSIPRHITSADIDRDGRLDLVTADFGANQLTLLEGVGNGTFTSAGTLPTAAGPSWVGTADFNRDGRLDLVSSALTGTQFNVRLGLGSFAFGPSSNFSLSAPLGLGIGDFNEDGKADIATAFNTGSAVGIALNDSGLPCPGVSFGPATRAFAASTSPLGIVKGDFDNDSRPDVVVTNDRTPDPDAVALLRASGPGVFDPPVTASTGAGTALAARVAAGDFDGDFRLDVVATNYNTNNISILPGTGGGFGAAIVIGVGQGPASPVVGEFNGDGKPDIAVTNNTDGDVSVLLNTGTGFNFSGPTDFPVGAGATQVVAGDLNGDGLLDLVTGLGAPAAMPKVAVLLGLGGGSFGAPIVSPPTPLSGIQPQGLVLGHFDGDFILDLATANRDSDNVSILRGNGDGTFTETAVIAVGDSPETIVTDDFNGDGRLDLATANTLSGGSVSVMLATGPGTFGPATSLPSAPGAFGIAAGDFTRDGPIDLVTTNPGADSVLLYVGNGAGGFGTPPAAPNGGFFADATEAGDFDRDGNLDVVVTTATSGQVRVLMGNGLGDFPTSATTPIGGNVQHAVPGDFDRDGILDVAVADLSSDTVRIMRGDGSGAFAAFGTAAIASFDPVHLAVGDFDRNGFLDVAAVLGGSGELAVYRYAGLPDPLGAGPIFTFGTGSSASAVVAGDFDGDLILDLAVANQGSNSVSVLKGGGDATFSPLFSATLAAGAAPSHLVAGDFDFDGDVDLVTANNGTQDVTFLQNSGAGTFPTSVTSPTGGRPLWIVAADLNQDGVLDLATANAVRALVSVLEGDGAGSFAPLVNYSPQADPFSLVAGDFNHDGKPDLVSANGFGNSLSVFANTNCASRRFELVQSPSACNVAGAAFASQPRLRLIDDGANLVQCDLNQVMAAIIPGTGTAGAVLGGTSMLSASGGILDYPDLSIDLDGAGYKLGFTRGGANPPIPVKTRRFTVGLSVDINGPATVCSGTSTSWNAVAPPFVVPPVYDRYQWMLDGSPVPGGPSIILAPLSPAGYILALTATLDACPAVKTHPFVAEPPLSVSINVLSGSTAVCPACTGGNVGVTEMGGGTITGRQWGYRTVSGGAITNIPGETGTTYTIRGAHFLGGTPGVYYLVETSSAACPGGPVTSNEIEVILYTTTATPTSLVFTATSRKTENELEWLNPPAPYFGTLVKFKASTTGTADCTFPTDPGDGMTLTLKVGAAGDRDSKLHGTLENGTTYCYAAFVAVAPDTYSVPGKNLKARPFDHTVGFVKWAFSTGVATLSAPGNGQGVMHVVANDGTVHSIKKGDSGGTWANPPWKPPVMPLPSQTGRPGSLPVTAGGENPVMFLSSQDGHVYSFATTTGNAAWVSPPVLGDAVQAGPSGVFTVFGGSTNLILVGTRNASTPNSFYGLRLTDGNFAPPGWVFTGGGVGSIGMINGQAAVDYATRRVYFASTEFSPVAPDNNTVWCVNFETGLSCGPTWPRAYGSISGGVTLRGTTLYVGIDGGGVRAIDAVNGDPIWSTPFATSGTVKGFVYADRLTDDLYFSTAGAIYSVSDTGGAAGVSNWLPAGVAFANPSTPVFIPGDDKVYVGGDNRLFRRRKDNGNAVDDFALGDPAVPAQVGAPTFDLRDGFIYVGTDAGVVYAIRIP